MNFFIYLSDKSGYFPLGIIYNTKGQIKFENNHQKLNNNTYLIDKTLQKNKETNGISHRIKLCSGPSVFVDGYGMRKVSEYRNLSRIFNLYSQNARPVNMCIVVCRYV